MSTFDTTKYKNRKLWEKSEKNQIDISSLPPISITYEPSSYLKKVTTIPILEDFTITASTNLLVSVDLKDFPEWIINHISVSSVINTTDGFSDGDFVPSAFDAFQAGTLKVGDLTFITQFHYWIAKLKDDNYILKIFNDPNMRSVISVSGIGYNTQEIPMFLNLSLKIINPRIYEPNGRNKR